jgi:hypothetical protein
MDARKTNTGKTIIRKTPISLPPSISPDLKYSQPDINE